MPRFHADELVVDSDIVRRLVEEAFPQHSGRALEAAESSGSSNYLFRLGDDLAVRLPRQPGGGATIDKEARWLPLVASQVSCAVPEVIGIGEPGFGYSERWAITRWLPGTRVRPPEQGRTGASGEFARDLAEFVRELRAMEVPSTAADDALTWYRGLTLDALDSDFRELTMECRGLDLALDLDEATRVWDRAVTASVSADAPVGWYHGDLLAENLLVDEAGRLAAVLDFGGLAIGRATVDLVVAWEVLDVTGCREFRRALDVSDAEWTASRGWALLIALMTFPYYGTSMPRRCAERLSMAQAAIAGV